MPQADTMDKDLEELQESVIKLINKTHETQVKLKNLQKMEGHLRNSYETFYDNNLVKDNTSASSMRKRVEQLDGDLSRQATTCKVGKESMIFWRDSIENRLREVTEIIDINNPSPSNSSIKQTWEELRERRVHF